MADPDSHLPKDRSLQNTALSCAEPSLMARRSSDGILSARLFSGSVGTGFSELGI